MSDTEPIVLRLRSAGGTSHTSPSSSDQASGQASGQPSNHAPSHPVGTPYRLTGPSPHPQTARFTRHELSDILNVYGRMVAAGEWRDYAIDMGRETAAFSVYRRTSEYPLYRIVKNPKLAKKQGAYSVVTATGLILKRGHELKRVLEVFDKSLRLVKS